METTNALLDQAKNAGNFNSDNALAQRLGLTRAVVSAWRQGRNPIPDERIAQLCALAKLDGPEWLARIHAERAQSPAERALWSKMLTRLAAAAIFLVPLSAFAKAENPAKSIGYAENAPGYVYYVKIAKPRARNETRNLPHHIHLPSPMLRSAIQSAQDEIQVGSWNDNGRITCHRSSLDVGTFRGCFSSPPSCSRWLLSGSSSTSIRRLRGMRGLSALETPGFHRNPRRCPLTSQPTIRLNTCGMSRTRANAPNRTPGSALRGVASMAYRFGRFRAAGRTCLANAADLVI